MKTALLIALALTLTACGTDKFTTTEPVEDEEIPVCLETYPTMFCEGLLCEPTSSNSMRCWDGETQECHEIDGVLDNCVFYDWGRGEPLNTDGMGGAGGAGGAIAE